VSTDATPAQTVVRVTRRHDGGSFQARRAAAGGTDPVGDERGDDRVLAHVRRSRGNDDDSRDAREDDHWPAADLGRLARPCLAAGWEGGHEAAAAWRNDARSPHASGPLSGWAS
jgi:hypothetical protein